MKPIRSFHTLFFLFVLNVHYAQKTIEIPINLVNGFGPFVALADIVKRPNPNSKYAKLELEVRGIPENWENPFIENIQFDPNQFYYQNYQIGLIDQEWFEELNIDIENRQFSEEPIKCFAYMVVGKDQAGNWVYKIDADNDLDFSNNKEHIVPIMSEDWSAHQVEQHKVLIKHETVLEGKIVQLESPVLFRYVPKLKLLIRNFPQHAVAQFQGKDIYISSNDFTSTSYDHIRYIVEGAPPDNPQGLVDILLIDNKKYQVVGVRIDERKLILREISSEASLYPPQAGYPIFPIAGKEFTTGDPINIADFRGKFVFIEFWGSWCGPCMKALPMLKSIYDQIDTSKIEFLGIAVDSPKNILRVLSRENISWKQIQLNDQSPLLKNYNLDREGYPFSLLIDRNGKILEQKIPMSQLLQTLKALE